MQDVVIDHSFIVLYQFFCLAVVDAGDQVPKSFVAKQLLHHGVYVADTAQILQPDERCAGTHIDLRT